MNYLWNAERVEQQLRGVITYSYIISSAHGIYISTADGDELTASVTDSIIFLKTEPPGANQSNKIRRSPRLRHSIDANWRGLLTTNSSTPPLPPYNPLTPNHRLATWLTCPQTLAGIASFTSYSSRNPTALSVWCFCNVSGIQG